MSLTFTSKASLSQFESKYNHKYTNQSFANKEQYKEVCDDIVEFTRVRVNPLNTCYQNIYENYPCTDECHTISIKDEYRKSGNVFLYYQTIGENADNVNENAEYYGYINDDTHGGDWDEKLLDDIKLCYDNISSKHVDLMHELKALNQTIG